MALAHFLVLGLGGLLVGIPILLHLLMKPKPKVLQFPALRFVKEMHQTNQRSLRLRHWLLLLLRMLLLLALAAAFAKPSTVSAAFGDWLSFGIGALLSALVGLLLLYSLVFSKPANLPLAAVVGLIFALALAFTIYSGRAAFSESEGNIISDKQAPVATVLLVDSSPRLNYRIENQSLMERIQDFGRWLIGQLPLGSRVSITETNGEQPFFSVDISAARKRLNTLDINYATVPLPDALQQAVKFLADAEYERKEIYVFTDLTSVAWQNSGDSLKRLLEQYPNIDLFVVDVGVEEPQNFSLGELTLSADSVPIDGELEISTQVRCYGDGGTRVMRLNLEKPDVSLPRREDGKTIVPENYWTRPSNVSVPSNSVTSAKIVLQDTLKPGIHHGFVELDGADSLAEDDRRYFTIEVRPGWPVLIAHPNNVSPDNLSTALKTAGGIFDVKVVPQKDLAGEPLADYSAVFLLNPRPLSDSLWSILHDYVEGGGGLGVFLGHNALGADKQPSPQFRSEAAGEVLPGFLVRDWIRKQGDLILSLDNLSHPIMKEFRSRQTLDLWRRFPVYRHWEFDTKGDPNVQVIMRYTNGIGALLERRIGEGHVVCMTTPVTEPVRPDNRSSWNDLYNSSRGQIWPAWLLVFEISEYLSSGTRDRLNVGVSQSVTLFNDINTMPMEYRLFSPRDEDPVRITSADNVVRYKFTDTPGAYRLKGQRPNGETMVRGFSVNMASGLTDLQRINPELLSQILGEDRFQLAREQDEIQRQQGTARMGQEFYPILALMMCLLLALELILSNRFYKS